MCPPLPFHQHLTRLQSFQSNFRIFVHAHTLYGDNHPTCCFGIHSIGPQGCYVHRWNGYAGLCPPAHWLYAACPKNVAFSSIFALSPAEQAPSFFTCQGLFRRPISSSVPWAPSSQPAFEFSPIFNAILFTFHPCVDFRVCPMPLGQQSITPLAFHRIPLGFHLFHPLFHLSRLVTHTCIQLRWASHPIHLPIHLVCQPTHFSILIQLAPTPTSISVHLGSMPSSAHPFQHKSTPPSANPPFCLTGPGAHPLSVTCPPPTLSGLCHPFPFWVHAPFHSFPISPWLQSLHPFLLPFWTFPPALHFHPLVTF